MVTSSGNHSNNFLDIDRYPPKIIEATKDTYSYPRSFEELHLSTEVIQTLADDFKLRAPDRLQALALPMITKKPYRHLMVQARLGSGIRLCFVLAMLERLDFRLGCTPQVVVICPTSDDMSEIRSLVLAVGKHCKDLKVESVDGLSTCEVDAHILIGLPEAIYHHRRALTDIKMVILDDADYMIYHHVQQRYIDAIIESLTPKPCHDFVVKQPDNVYQLLLSYASLTDYLRSFVTELLPPYANELLMLPPSGYNNKLLSLPQGHLNFLFVNEEERCVFISKLLKLPVSDEEEKVLAVLEIMNGAFADQQVVIYVDRTTDVTLLKQRLGEKFEASDIVVAQPQPFKMKKNESNSLLSFRVRKTRVLITSVRVSTPACFDNSKVSLVIFYDLPMILDGPDFELYYRIATSAGRNCNEGLVFHLVDEKQDWVMTSYERHFMRCGYWLNGYGLNKICKADRGSLRKTIERNSTNERR